MRRPLALVVLSALALWGQKYNGPRPSQRDVLYLVQADRLIEVEVTQAKEENRKDESVFVVQGATSPARTPLAEPIFLLDAEKINPAALELHRFEVRNGRREVAVPLKRKRSGPRPLRISVTRLEGRLYRIEADQTLENGEYSLSPNDSNLVFCFQVY